MAYLRYVALLWGEFVTEIRWFWDQAIPLPRMPPLPGPGESAHVDMECCLIYQVSSSPYDVHVSSSSYDMECCLIYQKIQLLNICIRKKRAAKKDPFVDGQQLEFDLALLQEAHRSSEVMMGPLPAAREGGELGDGGLEGMGEGGVGGERGRGRETETHVSGDGVTQTSGGVSLRGSSGGDEVGGGGEESCGVLLGNSDQLEAENTQISCEHAPEGVRGILEGMRLFHTGEVMNEPYSQDHPVLTEDRFLEQQMLMDKLSSSTPSALRAKAQILKRALYSEFYIVNIMGY